MFKQARQAGPPVARNFSGTGGELMDEHAKAAGTKFIFTNPGSYEIDFFDALVDRPDSPQAPTVAC